MKVRINKLDIMIILLWCAIFPFYIPIKDLYYIYQLVVTIVIWLFCLSEIRRIPLIIFLWMYPITIIVSSIINRNTILYTQVVRGTTGALLMMGTFLIIHMYIRLKGTERLFAILYRMSKVYAVISILWVLGLIVIGKLGDAVQNEFLFLGGKFPTAYMLIFNLMLFLISWKGNKLLKSKYKKTIFFVLCLVDIIVCILIETATGVVAIALFFVFMILPGKILKIVNKPVVLIMLIVGSMVFISSINIIISLPIVQSLIVNVLHEDLSLTGRMQLYELLFPLMMKSGLWGGGYGSYVATRLGYHGWYNAQNGLAEIILTYGFLGAGSFLLMVFTVSLKSKEQIKPLNSALLVFIIIAIVEIPFNMSFVLLLALIMMSNCKNIGKYPFY